MTLRLFLDECIQDRHLVKRLRDAGHDVLTVSEAGLVRGLDREVFEAAIADNRLVLSFDCEDFHELHRRKLVKNVGHPGILLIYQPKFGAKAMSIPEVVRAIANLEALGLPLHDQCHTLNEFKY